MEYVFVTSTDPETKERRIPLYRQKSDLWIGRTVKSTDRGQRPEESILHPSFRCRSIFIEETIFVLYANRHNSIKTKLINKKKK